jgi:hypothetical protein
MADNNPNNTSSLMRFECFLSRHKTLGEFIALIAALGVLGVYVWANWVSTAALRVSRDTANRQLRAYVGILGGHVTTSSVGPNPVDMVEIDLKNFGQTPAHDVVAKISYVTISIPAGEKIGDLPKGFDYEGGPPAVAGPNGPPQTYLDPGQDLATYAPVNTSIKIMDAEYNRRNTTYIYGSIFFTDTYNVRRVREYCYRFIPSPLGANQLFSYGPHNLERVIKQP